MLNNHILSSSVESSLILENLRLFRESLFCPEGNIKYHCSTRDSVNTSELFKTQGHINHFSFSLLKENINRYVSLSTMKGNK